MRSRTHILIGFIAFIAYSYLIHIVSKTANIPWLYGLVAVVVGSIIPDILEPATNSRHRGTCHSIGELKIMAFLCGITAFVTIKSLFFSHFIIIYLASCFFLGYVFHLLADSITPAGLPR
jgi:membrane-bound metal-dependent hydrolase YbcI (DUF457 family)